MIFYWDVNFNPSFNDYYGLGFAMDFFTKGTSTPTPPASGRFLHRLLLISVG